MKEDFEKVVAAILEVEKRFEKGAYGEGEEADSKAIEAIEKILLAAN